MKLEIKHLAAYLPYELRWKNSIIGKIITMIGCEYTNELRIRLTDGLYAYDVCKLKPILRPLSDLTKEIEHNGERFVPIRELFQIAYYSVYGYRFDNITGVVGSKCEFVTNSIISELLALKATEEINDKVYNYGFTVELPNYFRFSVDGDFLTIPNFDIYQKLFEWHFDVFGLIPAGLAIDINTLNN